MDKSDLIDRLNEDLATEFQSIVQYVQHAATVKGAEYGAIVAEIGKHVGQELQHAQTLAAQIDFLGGVPSGRVPSVPEGLEGAEALAADLELEERQLGRYRDRVAEATELGLPDVAEALRPLLTQTQDHVIDLREALGR